MLFTHKTNIKKLAIVLIGSGLLAACNHTGSSGSTSTNATQHATVGNLATTQKLLRIVNHSGSMIDSVSIVAKSGKLIHQSNTGLDCANNQACILDINGIVTDDTMLAKFYNSKNQLISMSSLKNNSQNLTYMSVYTNSKIFGANLFGHLVSYENSTPAVVFEQLKIWTFSVI